MSGSTDDPNLEEAIQLVSELTHAFFDSVQQYMALPTSPLSQLKCVLDEANGR